MVFQLSHSDIVPNWCPISHPLYLSGEILESDIQNDHIESSKERKQFLDQHLMMGWLHLILSLPGYLDSMARLAGASGVAIS